MEAVDSARGLVPRNAWLVESIRLRLDSVVEDERARVPVSVQEAAVAEPPPTGHREGCKCLNCERARGGVA